MYWLQQKGICSLEINKTSRCLEEIKAKTSFSSRHVPSKYYLHITFAHVTYQLSGEPRKARMLPSSDAGRRRDSEHPVLSNGTSDISPAANVCLWHLGDLGERRWKQPSCILGRRKSSCLHSFISSFSTNVVRPWENQWFPHKGVLVNRPQEMATGTGGIRIQQAWAGPEPLRLKRFWRIPRLSVHSKCHLASPREAKENTKVSKTWSLTLRYIKV